MYIASKTVGPVQTNCYLLGDEATGRAALIDPGDSGDALVRWAGQKGYQVTVILLTHAHFDHIGGVKAAQELMERKGVQVPVYVNDVDYPVARCGFMDSVTLSDVKDVRFYKEGDTVMVDSIPVQVLETPGHTKGSVCLIADGKAIFSGDTLFAGSCGRTDFPGGSAQEILRSLKRLALLEGDYQVYPGHESHTSLSDERAYNMYMLHALKNY